MVNNEYVSKERYEVEVRRIDERIDTVLGRIDDKMDAFMARIDTRFAKIEGRIDKVESFIGWTIGIAAIVITIGTFIIQIYIK